MKIGIKHTMWSLIASFLIFSPSILHAEQGDNSKWMEGLKNSEIPLNELKIPGTHHSGTGGIENTKAEATAEEVENFYNLFGKETPEIFDTIKDPLKKSREKMLSYVQTQGNTVANQLVRGVRYLDLNISSLQGNHYTVNGLPGEKMDTIIQEVKKFLDNNKKEIVIMDLQALNGNSSAEHVKIMKQIVDTFWSNIAFANELKPNSKISEFWSKNKQLIVVYRKSNESENNIQSALGEVYLAAKDGQKELRYSDILWTSGQIKSEQPSVTDFKKKLDEQVESMQNSSDSLNVLQATVVPKLKFNNIQDIIIPDVKLPNVKEISVGDVLDVFKNGVSESKIMPEITFEKIIQPFSIKQDAKTLNTDFGKWMENEWNNKKMNIIMVDWEMDSDIVGTVIKKNS